MTIHDYGGTTSTAAASASEPLAGSSTVPSSRVELAALTVTAPSSPSKKAAVLHASQETTHALEEASRAAEDAAAGTSTANACIQAVVDLEQLGHLAGATDDEFVGGLHREAHDRVFRPPFFEVKGPAASASAPVEEVQLRKEAGDDETALLSCKVLGSKGREDVPLEILPFDSLDMSDPLEAPFTTTEDDLCVGHDAFLLEVTQPAGEQNSRFVLALPETANVKVDEDHSFPMLEKTMSIMSAKLPTDIQDVQLEATANNEGGEKLLHLDLKIKRRVPFIGYFLLFFGFFALASAGAAFDLQGPRVSASMKTYWRLTSTLFLIFPMVVANLYREGLPKLNRREWLFLPMAAFCYAQMTTVFVISLALTSLANAFVFSNMTSLVIIVAKMSMGLPVLVLEAAGAVIGISGGIVCARANIATSDDEKTEVAYPHELLGNLIALSASFGTALYLAIARDLRPKCDLYVFMSAIFFLASFFVLAFMILARETVSFDRHPDHGMFGWMNATPDRLPLELFMAAVVNLIGTIGYISVLKYFDSIVVSVIMLMEPVVGVFIGHWVGVNPKLPCAQTWIGSAIVTVGSGLVVYSGSTKTESIDATKAVRPRSNTIDCGKTSTTSNYPSRVEMRHTPIMMKRPSPKKRAA